MLAETLLAERQHYESKVNYFKVELQKNEEEIEKSEIRLGILNDVNARLEESTAKLIIEHDIQSLKDEITKLQTTLTQNIGNLKAFERIVDELYNI
ncbi:hypothetical protein U5N28_09025 [Lysinibacillus telephonicus]|uniref:Uncharacterized protein n=1 Tax=Lysinibacillus telephonicus TaxID=1714840 RepID=A0A3S0HND1_9BACI|nr:hypothetical protein [Lysinibacillus telephonicus]RTQ95595.1 hypothetical protein EKG35_02620 [Lysinibacillus telephonicus]